MLFILGSHPLELWKALRRGMQMSVRATANARRLAGKAVVIGMVFAGLLLAPLQAHEQGMHDWRTPIGSNDARYVMEHYDSEGIFWIDKGHYHEPTDRPV